MDLGIAIVIQYRVDGEQNFTFLRDLLGSKFNCNSTATRGDSAVHLGSFKLVFLATSQYCVA